MRKLLRPILVVLLFRIDWKKLFFIGAMLTLFRVVVQISTLPHPLTEWSLFPSLNVSSYRNSNHEKKLRALAVTPDNRFNISQDAQLVVSINSTVGLSQRMQVPEKREQVSRQRKHRKHVAAVDKLISPPSPVRNVSTNLPRYIASLTPVEALAYAKREIENAPLVRDDQGLHTPLFQNVSAFKRSYELMELILKVYIYKEGKRPIFHQPYLRGIYSSEGWFMKLMEESCHFVTRTRKRLTYSIFHIVHVSYKGYYTCLTHITLSHYRYSYRTM